MTAQDLLARVRAGGLLPGGGPVVVLLSGGRDSVCLLDVAVQVAGREAVRALHVDYGLRPEAEGDEAACRALCARLEVPLVVERARRPAGEGAGGGNLHAWARDVRYGAGSRLASAMGSRPPARLAVGHTATDQAETVLYRLASSPGRRALLGMADEQGLLVRPLLRAGATREDTAAWCAARGLPWREDASNDDPRFARARVRTGLSAALRAVDPRAEANVVRDRRPAARGGGGARRGRRGGPRRVGRDRGRPPRRAARARWRASSSAAWPRRRPAACAGAPPAGSTTSWRSARARSTSATARAPSWPAACCASSGRRRGSAGTHRLRRRWPSRSRSGTSWSRPARSPAACRSWATRSARPTRAASLLLIGVLKGAVFFVADLMRSIDVPVEVDFMAVSSYGSATDSSGVVRILKDLDTPIEGRHVLIVEDIVDSGLTLQYLMRNLGARNPASLEVCALLTKPSRRKVDLPIKFVGFEIPDRFAIGYGLDHAERYRNLPYVAALEEREARS